MKPRWWMKPLGLVVGIAACLIAAEASVRIYCAWTIGPRVLLYGTGWYRNVNSQIQKRVLTDSERKRGAAEWSRRDSVELQSNTLNGYTKFFPNETKSTLDTTTGERIPATINKEGFRGADFSKEKPPGVVRILTLGASSTFGYYDRDDETYPYLLQQTLNGSCRGDVRFEVINFAIPHADSANIRAMFMVEGIDLAPDAVTFYEGRNDSTPPAPTEYHGVVERLYAGMLNRLLLAGFLDQLLVGKRASITDPTLKLEPYAAERSRVFLGNLNAILDACRKNGIYFIAANQQATSGTPGPHDEQERLKLRGITYGEEARQVRDRLERKESVTAFEYSFLIHQKLMQDLQQWASAQGVPFVDVIGALDRDRHLLLSWVHLHPDANRVVASKLSEVLLRKFCAGRVNGISDGASGSSALAASVLPGAR